MAEAFPIAVIFLFLGASVGCFLNHQWAKAFFYLLSALINVNVLFMK